ncbi:uncharacterized protein ISCGN_022723 [Ixodes scapularis]
MIRMRQTSCNKVTLPLRKLALLTALEGTHAALPPRPSQLIPSEQNQACPQLPRPEPSQTLPVFLPLPSPVLGSSQTIPSEPNQACPQPPCVAKELSQSPPVLTRVLSPAPSHGSDSALLTTPVAGSLKRKAPGDSSRGKRRLLTPKTRLIRNFRVWEQLRAEGLSFLMTNRLNQDCLENFFSVIRQKGGFRESPDTEQFKAPVKALMNENLMRSSRCTTCEEDLDEVLLCVSSFPSRNLPPDVIGEEDADHDHVSGTSDTAPEMDILRTTAQPTWQATV